MASQKRLDPYAGTGEEDEPDKAADLALAYIDGTIDRLPGDDDEEEVWDSLTKSAEPVTGERNLNLSEDFRFRELVQGDE